MKREQTFATCRLCGRSFGKRQMTNHLKACWKQHAAAAPGKKAPRRWFHLVIEGRYSPDYWLHMQVSANCTFGDLDGTLRSLWLECCGHLSAFEFPLMRALHGGGVPFDIAALLGAAGQEALPSLWDESDDDALMGESLGSKLAPAMVVNHQYDFGSTTELVLRVAGEHNAPAMKGRLKLLARNDPPNIPCSVCGKPATQLCQECICESEACELCDACARKHDCSEEMIVPLVNSPRTGICGYCGPSVEP
jgi:hypothetical protein